MSPEVLSVRLARLALELNQIVLALVARPPAAADLSLFVAAAHHLLIGLDELERVLGELELQERFAATDRIAA